MVESGSLVAGGAVLGQGTKLVGRRVSLEEPVEGETEEEGIRESFAVSRLQVRASTDFSYSLSLLQLVWILVAC